MSPQDERGEGAHGPLVFDQKDRLGSLERRVSRRRQLRAVDKGNRELDAERTTPAERTFDPDGATLLRDGEHRRKTEAGALANAFRCEKRFEHARLRRTIHPDPSEGWPRQQDPGARSVLVLPTTSSAIETPSGTRQGKPWTVRFSGTVPGP